MITLKGNILKVQIFLNRLQEVVETSGGRGVEGGVGEERNWYILKDFTYLSLFPDSAQEVVTISV